jgi:hypothetical protein
VSSLYPLFYVLQFIAFIIIVFEIINLSFWNNKKLSFETIRSIINVCTFFAIIMMVEKGVFPPGAYIVVLIMASFLLNATSLILRNF